MPTGPRSRRRSRWEAEAGERRRAWEESGLTRVAYARKTGLAPSTFSRWMRKLKESEREGTTESGASEGQPVPSQARGKPGLAARAVKTAGARLLAVEVGAAVEDELGGGTSSAATPGRPVEIALPSGIRIRYPGGVGREELSKLVILLEKEC